MLVENQQKDCEMFSRLVLIYWRMLWLFCFRSKVFLWNSSFIRWNEYISSE
jgi:hypothetical protein